MLPNKTTLCLLVLLLYWATLQSASAQSPATEVTTAAVAAAAPSAAGATAGSAVCSLSLAGFGDRLGIKFAKLSCTGGTITIAAHKLLRDFWGPTMVLPGVVWGNQECVTNDGCLISICGGSNAVFNLASVSALKGGGDKPEVRIAVCVNRQSTVTFRKSTFTGLREMTSMAIHTAGTSALVDQCTLRDNVYRLDGHSSSGIVVDMARLTILSSTLAGITGVGNAGAVTALTTAHVTIQDTKFQSNTATNGGAIHAEVNSTVVIQSSSFTGNKASERGGAIFARGQARVEVLRNRPGFPRTTFTNNNATLCGGDIRAADSAVVDVNSVSFWGGTANIGGSLCVYAKATLSITDVVLNGARAVNGNGGAVQIEDDAIVRVVGTTLSGCKTDYWGGGFSVRDRARVEIINSTITKTSAARGGALALQGNCTVYVEDSMMSDGRASKDAGGCVYVEGTSQLSLLHTVVSGCSTPMAGGGVAMQTKSKLELVNSTIRNNTAGKVEGGSIVTKTYIHGGGIAVFDSASFVVEGSEITGNYAQYTGGGLYLEDDTTTSFQGNTPTRIHNNEARTIAGGIRLASTLPEKDLARFVVSNNTSLNSPNIGVVATSIEVVKSNGDELLASDSRDGFLQVTLNVSGVNGMPSADDLVYTVYDNNTTTLFTQTVSTRAGNLKELAISLKLPPGTYQVVFANAFFSSCGCAKANLTVNIVRCPKGHVTGGRDDTCNRCPKGLFSFNSQDVQCSICGANTVCPGGATVWAAPGLWHSAPQSIQMHRCFNPNACMGGDAVATNGSARADTKTTGRLLLSDTSNHDYKTAQCSGHYQGNLCGQCKPGYGKVRPFQCRKCMSTSTIIVLYITAAVFMIGFVKLLVHLSMSADLTITRTDLQTPTPAEMLRALVIHAQWLYIISMMVGVPWPTSLAWPMQVIGGIWSSTSGSSIGIECILKGSKAFPIAIQKLLICLLTPAGILSGVLMIEAGMHYLRPGKSRQAGLPQAKSHKDFASVVMCIVFMFLPTWVNTSLSLFTCVGLDTAVEAPYQAEAVGSWWVEDFSQLCYSRASYHRGWALGLGVPLTLLFCAALPAGVFVFMWYSRKQGKLADLDFQRRYGFMYRLWKDEWCWWESVALLQTISLVMVSTFGFALGGYLQCLLSSTVLAIVGMLMLAVKPFKCSAAGRVAVLSVCVLYFTTQAALSFIPSSGINPGPVYGNILGAVILVANVGFLAGSAWQLVRVVDWAAVMDALRKPACCKGKPPVQRSACASSGPARARGPYPSQAV